jgi:hypothetical protein
MFALFLFLLPTKAVASTLLDYLEHHPHAVSKIDRAYQDALRDFQNDPVFCSPEGTECERLAHEERERVRSPRFGQEWVQAKKKRPSPFGPVLTFRNTNLMTMNEGKACSGVLSLPENPIHQKHLSFDLFCE